MAAAEARACAEVQDAESAVVAWLQSMLDAPLSSLVGAPSSAAAAVAATAAAAPRTAVLAAAAQLVGLLHSELAPMPLILVLGALGREEGPLRASAAAVLGNLCAQLGVTMRALVLHSAFTQSVLEFVGSRADEQPRLIAELARMVRL